MLISSSLNTHLLHSFPTVCNHCTIGLNYQVEISCSERLILSCSFDITTTILVVGECSAFLASGSNPNGDDEDKRIKLGKCMRNLQ